MNSPAWSMVVRWLVRPLADKLQGRARALCFAISDAHLIRLSACLPLLYWKSAHAKWTQLSVKLAPEGQRHRDCKFTTFVRVDRRIIIIVGALSWPASSKLVLCFWWCAVGVRGSGSPNFHCLLLLLARLPHGDFSQFHLETAAVDLFYHIPLFSAHTLFGWCGVCVSWAELRLRKTSTVLFYFVPNK